MIKVYKFHAQQPAAHASLVREQIRSAARYYNDLIQIERGRRAAIREVERRPEIVALEAEVTRCLAAEQIAASDLAVTRKASRKRSESTNQIAALKRAREDSKQARLVLRDARAIVRPQVQAARDIIAERAGELVRSSRAHCGCYWGTYLLVEAAAQAAAKDTPLYDGAEPLDPDFRRFDGQGRVGVQIQYGMPWKLALAGTDMRLRIERVPDRRDPTRVHPVYAILHMRVSSDGRDPVWATWPVKMHRPVPEGALVKGVVVSLRHEGWRERGPREVWTVQVTVEEEAPLRLRDDGEAAPDSAVAVDLGWRVIGDEIRVARCSDGQELRLPRMTGPLGSIGKANELRGLRDELYDIARPWFAAVLSGWQDAPEWLREQCETIGQWKSTRRLHHVLLAWRDKRQPGDEPYFAALDAWRARDHHLERWESDARRHGLDARTEVYRQFAARLAREYRVLVLEDFDLSRVARRPRQETKASNKTARSNRHATAVSELRLALCNAFRSRDGETAKVDPYQSTHECCECGHVDQFDAALKIMHTCSKCGALWDQDDNAALVLEARWRERSSGGVEPGSTRDGEESNESAEIAETRWQRAARMRREKSVRMTTAREAVGKDAE